MENFLSIPENKKSYFGIEKNISAKKFIEKITYSLENIKIKFKIGHPAQRDDSPKSPAPPVAGLGENQANDKEKVNFNKNKKFEMFNTAAGLGLEGSPRNVSPAGEEG